MSVRACVMKKPNVPLEVMTFDEPPLREGDVLIRCLYADVCGTDVHLWEGRLAGVPYPIIPGHVAVGVVEKVAGPVTSFQGDPVLPGQIVTYHDVDKTCGKCWACLIAKSPTRCPHRKVYGITYSSQEGLLGGWSEKILLRAGVHIYHLPKSLEPEAFIAAGCGAPTGLHAVERGRVGLGESVMVQGTGPVGLSACAFAKLSGASLVVATGAPATRLRAARSMGADEVLSVDETTPEQREEVLRSLTHSRGVDVVIEACGQPGAIPEGIRYLRDGGRYVLVGHYTDTGTVPINPHLDITRKHAEILGCWGTEVRHSFQAMRLLSENAKEFPWASLLSRTYKLSEAEQALRDVKNLKVIKAVIAPG